MALQTGGEREYPSGHRRFFGPGYFGFQRVDNLPAVAESPEVLNFFKGIKIAAETSGATVAPYFVATGGHYKGNALRYIDGATASQPNNYGISANYDAGAPTPYALGMGGDLNPTARDALDLEVGYKDNNVFPYPGVYTYVLMPDPTVYDLYWQDWGRNPVADNLDNHQDFISRKDVYYSLIHWSTLSASDRINGGHMNAWRSRFRTGQFNYAAASTKRDVIAQQDPDGDLGGASGANANFPRYEGAQPTLSYDSAYGQIGEAFSCDTVDIFQTVTTKYGNATSLFGHCNGGGVPYVDHIARYDEFNRGLIPHQLLCVVWEGADQGASPHDGWNNPNRGFRWPAQRSDGEWEVTSGDADIYWDAAAGIASLTDDGPNYEKINIPMYGWIVRLKASSVKSKMAVCDASSHVGAPFAKVFLRALFEYGAIIMDKNTVIAGDAKFDNGTGSVSDLPNRYPNDNFALYNSGNMSNITRQHGFGMRIAYDSRFDAISTNLGTDVALDKDNPAHMTEVENNPLDIEDAVTHCIETVVMLDYDDFEFVDMEANNLHGGDVWTMEVT